MHHPSAKDAMINRLKVRIYQILERTDIRGTASQIVDIFIWTLIALNLMAFTLETVDQIWNQYRQYFILFEEVSIAVFTVEYILRVWICTVNPDYKHSIRGRLRFMFTPLMLIDLIAIFPFYLPLLFPDLRFLRSLRLFRFFRILKLSRYSASLRTLGRVIRSKKEELIITFFVLFILLFCASSLIYFAEHEAQAEAFPNIPMSMWWGVITLTTVGYGDVYPVTLIGKLLGATLAVLGIGIFALPAGILASGFSEELQVRHPLKRKRTGKFCPHCGKPIH